MLTHALVVGALAALSPPAGADTQGSAAPMGPAPAPAAPPPAAEPTASRDRRAGPNDDSARRRDRKPPWSWRFVGAHYGTGVMASLLVLPGSYALAGFVGHRGKGLGPVVGALLIGAFLPSPIIYTTQWAVGRRLMPRRERYWPGFLVQQAGHLAVFAGSVLGGASFREFRDAAPVVLTDALVVTGLSSLTAEATRRPRPRPAELSELSWERQERLWRPRGFTIVVPILKVRLP